MTGGVLRSLSSRLVAHAAARGLDITPAEAQGAPGAAANLIRPQLPPLPVDFLSRTLQEEDTRPQESRIGAAEYTHASTISKAVCARQYVLAALHDVRWEEAVTGGHRLLWAFGRTAEDHIRKTLIRSRQGGQVYGCWKCACGRTEHVGTRPNVGSQCRTCQRPVDKYYEQPHRDEEYRIIGNPDVAMLAGRHMVVVEIKSIVVEEWNKLVAPLPEHALQATLYHWLMGRSGIQMHDEVVVIYACKQFKFGNPYKEFHVNVRRANGAPLGLALETALAIKRGLEAKQPPQRWALCPSPDSKTACKCPLAPLCFNLPN